jgi:quercetin dioxygenase-like cupin family protein
MQTGTAGTRHIYQLDALEGAPAGPCSAAITPPASSSAVSTGAVVRGERIQVALVKRERGTGSPLAADANEQFGYVVRGALVADIDGEIVRVPQGHVVHVPAGVPHSLAASAEGDALYYVMKDTRGEFGHASADGPGVAAEPRTRIATGSKVQYVYDIAHLDAVPDGPTSAQVVPRNYISGKSSSYGAALKGERLQVGHVHKAVGSGTKLHTHPNEQFSFVLEGTMLYEIAGEKLEAPPNSLTHLPAGIVHGAIASAAGDVLTFVAKDTRHGMSGPPVDGIEDGPVYLAGFGPGKK